jgi:hypothetical protein
LDFDVYVATDVGDIWVVRVVDQTFRFLKRFASGLDDPWRVAYSPRRVGGNDAAALYVADRTAGEIFKYTSDGVQSVFVSDTGIPNFLAFETD